MTAKKSPPYVVSPYVELLERSPHPLGPPGKESFQGWTDKLRIQLPRILRPGDEAEDNSENDGEQAGDTGQPDVGHLIHGEVVKGV